MSTIFGLNKIKFGFTDHSQHGQSLVNIFSLHLIIYKAMSNNFTYVLLFFELIFSCKSQKLNGINLLLA